MAKNLFKGAEVVTEVSLRSRLLNYSAESIAKEIREAIGDELKPSRSAISKAKEPGRNAMLYIKGNKVIYAHEDKAVFGFE